METRRLARGRVSRRNKYDPKGRSPTDRFARLAHFILLSPAYRALSPNARALLVEFAMMENGKNNGVGLFMSVRDAADRMGVVDLHAASNALKELQELGFIEMTHEGHFAVKASTGSRARFWRLTWQAVKGERGPTNDFLHREPIPRTRARRRMERGLRALKRWRQESQNAVVDSTTHAAKRVVDRTIMPCDSVVNSPTQDAGNGQKTPIRGAVNSTTYTAVPSEEARAIAARDLPESLPPEEIDTAQADGMGWWVGDRCLQANQAIFGELLRQLMAAPVHEL